MTFPFAKKESNRTLSSCLTFQPPAGPVNEPALEQNEVAAPIVKRAGGGCVCSHHCHGQIEMKCVFAFGEVAERSGHCSFCLADYRSDGRGVMKSDEEEEDDQ